MWNSRLDELQAGIKIAGRNIKNHRYADDTILMTESEEELKNLFENGEGGEWKKKNSLKLNIKKKTKIMASGFITSWQIEGGKMEAVTFHLLGL